MSDFSRYLDRVCKNYLTSKGAILTFWVHKHYLDDCVAALLPDGVLELDHLTLRPHRRSGNCKRYTVVNEES